MTETVPERRRARWKSRKFDLKMQKVSALERFGLGLCGLSEKWFPDAWVFALLGIVFIFFFGIVIGESPLNLALAGGKQFWVLIPFTMQMAMIIIGGYVVASTPAVYWLIRKVALIPKNGKTAIAWIAFFSMLTSLISWGLSLIFSGLLVREMTRRFDDMDYRAAGQQDTWGWAQFGPWGFPHRPR